MKKKKANVIQLTKETPEARKTRVSSGVRFRAVTFKSKKKRLLEKYARNETE
ncbi:MAG: hypothetical protein FWG28_08315 [Clostridiales bacterium]|nr:hypothetical protein [Clostridiales bacterium]